jgi:protein N-lysine methyltransferase METTL21D
MGTEICGDVAGSVGSMTVEELDWQKPETFANVQGPFDYILAADCVYNEDLVHDLLKVVLLYCGSKTTGDSLARLNLTA